MSDQVTHAILFYDGVCGLCDRAVQFVLRHDTEGRFRFAAVQSDYARPVLARYGRDPRDLDTMYLLLGPGTPHEQLLAKSDAILAILRQLDGAWRLLAAACVLPRTLRDRAYDFIARHRYRWFGRYDQCRLPRPEERERFVDADEPAQHVG